MAFLSLVLLAPCFAFPGMVGNFRHELCCFTSASRSLQRHVSCDQDVVLASHLLMKQHVGLKVSTSTNHAFNSGLTVCILAAEEGAGIQSHCIEEHAGNHSV